MTRRGGARGRSIAGLLALAVAAGLVVHLLLAPVSQDDIDPPVCYSLIGYEVQCGNLSYTVAAVTTCLVAGLLLGAAALRSNREPSTGEAAAPTSAEEPPAGDPRQRAPG